MRLLAALSVFGAVFLMHTVVFPTGHFYLTDFEKLMVVGTALWFVWTTVTDSRSRGDAE
jgi:hypothetical protein